jgi:hypothetical protein
MWLWFVVGCAFQPTWGRWTYTQTSVDVDTCGLEPYFDPAPATVLLLEGDDGAFEIDDDASPFTCVLDGKEFSCPDRWPDRVAAGDTTLEADGEAHGVFDSAAVARGSQGGTFDCVDLACETGAALLGMNPPCDVTVSYVLALQE